MNIVKAFNNAYERAKEKNWDYIYILVDVHGTIFVSFFLNKENYEFYPSFTDVIDNVVPMYLAGFIYGAMIDSFCSEQNARMTAMNSANDNAEEIMSELSVEYNRVRQAAITQEITEVAAGAKALRRKKKKKTGEAVS